ncbi:caspase, EACC1-associated type [Nocardia tengchongensis]
MTVSTERDWSRSRAILIGVWDYTELPPVPAARHSFERITRLLIEVCGWPADRISTIENPQNSGDLPTRLIREFSNNSDTVLLYFVGHGLLLDPSNKLALAVGDTNPDPHLRHTTGLKFDDIRVAFDASRATTRIAILDCCYSAHAIPADGQLGDESADIDFGNPGFCIVTASRYGRTARYETTGERPETYFSRCFSDIVETGLPNQDRWLTLGAIFGALDKSLVAATGPQPYMLSSGSAAEFPFARNRAFRPSIKLHKSSVLSLTRDPDHARGSAHPLIDWCVAQQAARQQDAGNDPWWDGNFLDRVVSHTDQLVARIFRDRPPADLLTTEEAALLVAFPYIHRAWSTYWIERYRHVTLLQPADGERDSRTREFHDYAKTFTRLHQRGWPDDATDTDEAQAIRWWLFHRWLLRVQERSAPREQHRALGIGNGSSNPAPQEDLFEHVGPDEFGTELLDLVRIHRRGSDVITDINANYRLREYWNMPDRPGTSIQIRIRLIGLILVLADRLALESTRLPPVVAEHLGVPDPVDLDALRTTLAKATWSGEGIWDLSARCTHPAVEMALREHVSAANDLLLGCRRAAEGSLAVLAALPTHLSCPAIDPAVGTDNKPAYQQGSFFSFEIDGARIRELLMGENLYRNPALAIRELYQNALDACRYRRARLMYDAGIKHEEADDWRGRIVFTKFEQGGETYLSCHDNGVGMGIRELVGSFGKVGVRLSDSPDYIEEQHRWAKYNATIEPNQPQVRFFPNSRFGIGVLSYFMLADEFTVTTRRTHADLTAGDRLEVTVSGPDSMVRVRKLTVDPRQRDLGTTVTLRLHKRHSDIDCATLLRDVLWISEFDVVVRDLDTERDAYTELAWWESDMLSQTALVNVDMSEDTSTVAITKVAHRGCRDARVWWCDAEGTILADGLSTDQVTHAEDGAEYRLFGAIVNLKDDQVPGLSVDRRVITLDERHRTAIDSLLRDGIPEFVRDGLGPRTLGWLGTLAEHDPQLADEIGHAVVADRHIAWRIGGIDVPVSAIGCFPGDNYLAAAVAALRRKRGPKRGEFGPTEMGILGSLGTMRRWGLDWRFSAWVAAGLIDGLRWTADDLPAVARPTDAIILSDDASGDSLAYQTLVTAHHLRRPPSEIAQRIRELGHTPGDRDWNKINQIPLWELNTALELASGNELGPDDDPCFGIASILAAAIDLAAAPSAIAGWLIALGYQVDGGADRRWPAIRPDDRALLGLPAIRTSRRMVSAVAVIATAANTCRHPNDVAERLRELDYQVDPYPGTVPNRTAAREPWLTGAVGNSYIVFAAGRSEYKAVEVAARLKNAGCSVNFPEVLTPREEKALNAILEHNDFEHLSPDKKFSTSDIMAEAARQSTTPREIIEAIRTLGFEAEDTALTSRESDSLLLSRDMDGLYPWIAPGTKILPIYVLMNAYKGKRKRKGEGMHVCTEVADRYRELGFDVIIPTGGWPVSFSRLDRAILQQLDPDYDIDHEYEFDFHAPTLGLSDITRLTARTNAPLVVVVKRLQQFGIAVPELFWDRLHSDPDGLSDDLALLGVDPYASGGSFDDLHAPDISLWLGSDQPIPAHKVLTAAAALLRTPAVVATRLDDLGVPVALPDSGPWPVPDDDDRILLSAELDGERPYLDLGTAIPAGHVMAAAVRLRTSPHAVASRLRKLGAELTEYDWPLGKPELPSVRYLRTDRRAWWLDPVDPIPAMHLFRVAFTVGTSIEHVAQQLVRFGYRLPAGIDTVAEPGE